MGRIKKTSVGNPHPVDVHVGAKVRTRRKELGMSQEALAERCGVTFQQVQKYERGANRVSASMLVMIATALQSSPGYFVDDAPGTIATAPVGDGWTAAQRIFSSVPGALEALYCLDALDGPGRTAVVATLQLAAGRPRGRPEAKAA